MQIGATIAWGTTLHAAHSTKTYLDMASRNARTPVPFVTFRNMLFQVARKRSKLGAVTTGLYTRSWDRSRVIAYAWKPGLSRPVGLQRELDARITWEKTIWNTWVAL